MVALFPVESVISERRETGVVEDVGCMVWSWLVEGEVFS